MDDFNWVSEPEKEKQHWLKEYWLHGVAAVVILALLLLLLFNPSSKKVSSEVTETQAENTANEKNSHNKQITFRLPDKTTKIVESENKPADNTITESATTPAENTATAPITTPEIKTTTIPPKTLPPASLGVINRSTPASVVKDINATPQATAASTTTGNESVESATTPIPPVEIPLTESTPAVSGTASTPATPVAAPKTNPMTATNTASPVTNPTTTASTAAPAMAAAQTAKPTPPVTPTTPPAVANAPQQTTSVLHMMLKRPPTNFTVQLYASNSSTQVQQFIARHNLSTQSAMVKVWQNGQDAYLLLYGDYANKAQADAAINQLDPALRNENPSARSMQTVQEGIRQRLSRGR